MLLLLGWLVLCTVVSLLCRKGKGTFCALLAPLTPLRNFARYRNQLPQLRKELDAKLNQLKRTGAGGRRGRGALQWSTMARGLVAGLACGFVAPLLGLNVFGGCRAEPPPPPQRGGRGGQQRGAGARGPGGPQQGGGAGQGGRPRPQQRDAQQGQGRRQGEWASEQPPAARAAAGGGSRGYGSAGGGGAGGEPPSPPRQQQQQQREGGGAGSFATD